MDRILDIVGFFGVNALHKFTYLLTYNAEINGK